jgi:hypothetical protein
MSYPGEEHPAAVKRALTVAVSQLPLKDKRAIYKFRLLAGVRWTPTPPKDSGIKLGESAGHGYVKIACEDFPEPAMNLKWVSDRLDDLIKEANVRSVFPYFESESGLRRVAFFLRRTTAIALKIYQLTGDTWRQRRGRLRRGNLSGILQVVLLATFPHPQSEISQNRGFPVHRKDAKSLLVPGPSITSHSNIVLRPSSGSARWKDGYGQLDWTEYETAC